MNAKLEFISATQGKEVLCCEIQVGSQIVQLTTGWTQDEWDEFIARLNFEYDSGYGTQELYGTIWYKDGTWSGRGEYDGSEWWEYNRCPPIPKQLNRLDKVRDQKIDELSK
jgi:hypothetical protein